jgi:pyruvate/2-oxoglutarate dehydrogenase complex dihydrolipoamide dehydrogenase (E3) component
VTIIERAGLGGSAVLTDVVPSKTLIATADLMTRVGEAAELGVKFEVEGNHTIEVLGADGIEIVEADAVLLAVGAYPRELPGVP